MFIVNFRTADIPLQGPITTNANTPKLRMNCERLQIAMQKAIFYTLKGHLLHCKRWPFGKSLTINGLHDCQERVTR